MRKLKVYENRCLVLLLPTCRCQRTAEAGRSRRRRWPAPPAHKRTPKQARGHGNQKNVCLSEIWPRSVSSMCKTHALRLAYLWNRLFFALPALLVLLLLLAPVVIVLDLRSAAITEGAG